MVEEVGSVLVTSQREDASDFKWHIAGSQTKEIKLGNWVCSPPLYFAGSEWQVLFGSNYPGNASRPIVLRLRQWRRRSPSPALVVRYWLGAIRVDEGQEEEAIGKGTCRLAAVDWSPLYHPWLPFPELQRRIRCPTSSSGTLTFFIRLRSGPETDDEMKSLVELDEAAKKFTKTDFKDIQILQEHFKQLLHSADDHDVLITVKGKEFRAHKNVLRARSPVFHAMFGHKMKENMEDTVNIEDMDPDCFGTFLAYIYTGEVENLSTVNAMPLYYAADKYNFPALKRRCVDLLESALSTSLVCDAITLALTHGDEELLESAMAYFTKHQEEVMETVEWQRFLLSNPIRASEVCLTALKRRRKSHVHSRYIYYNLDNQELFHTSHV